MRTLYKKCESFGSLEATCNCGVLARAGDDVIIIDKCDGRYLECIMVRMNVNGTLLYNITV